MTQPFVWMISSASCVNISLHPVSHELLVVCLTRQMMSFLLCHFIGEDDVEKALELSGRSVGGFNIVVTEVLPHQPIMIDFSPESSMSLLVRLAEEQRKEKETTE
ncbi:hypothetical protein Rs2_04446 [Raphanus sativus]|nr:hypothetical protein Rs2_04446 [Raphanus sativus]